MFKRIQILNFCKLLLNTSTTNMEKSIILNFPPKISREDKHQLTELVNKALSSVCKDVAAWSGFVDVLKTPEGNYTLIGIADDAEVRDKMQDLLEKIELKSILVKA
jgi:hypothetical protein